MQDTELLELSLSPAAPRQRRLLFVAPRHAFYQSVCRALESHFDTADIEMLERMPDAGFQDDQVDLVLLAPGACPSRTELVSECRQRFPSASVVLIIEGPQYNVSGDPQVQAILQADLPLEVWFAVIQLVLAGGQYLFNATAVPKPSRPVEVNITQPKESRLNGKAAKSLGTLGALTSREREILRWISEGYQNKLIANRMALSEHTVKAHVHNLIAKLHVTNRTQAAAVLHEQKNGAYFQPGEER